MVADTSIASLASQMSEATKRATHYITTYMTKTQPHLTNLWLLLRRGLDELHTELTEHSNPLEPRYVASRSIMRMLTASERRRHKSMAEICHYLLDHPEAYTNARFRKLFTTNLVHRALTNIPVPSLQDMEPESAFWFRRPDAAEPNGDLDHADATPEHVDLVPGHQETDYLLRGAALADWPLYFYVAAVDRCGGLRLTDECAHAAFDPAHPDAGRMVQRIRLCKAWFVPQLAGISLPAPDKDIALFSLLMLLLLKPWSSADMSDLLLVDGVQHDSWAAALLAFRTQLSEFAPAAGVRAAPFTREYWAQRSLAWLLAPYSFSISLLPFVPGQFPILGSLHILEHADAILCHPPLINELAAPGHVLQTSGDLTYNGPASDDETATDDSYAADDPDELRFLDVAPERCFPLQWDSLAAGARTQQISCATSSQASYALSVDQALLHLQSPDHSALPNCPQTSHLAAASVTQLRRDARHWLQLADVDGTDDGDCFLPGPSPAPCPSNALPSIDALDLVEQHILRGHCAQRDGGLNCKQAMFLVTFALNLQVPRLTCVN